MQPTQRFPRQSSMEILGFALMIASFICAVIVIIDAFEDEIWKGIVCLLVWPYLIYYGFAEFEHDNKVMILTILLLSAAGQVGLLFF